MVDSVAYITQKMGWGELQTVSDMDANNCDSESIVNISENVLQIRRKLHIYKA
jgi:hypothetical protein